MSKLFKTRLETSHFERIFDVVFSERFKAWLQRWIKIHLKNETLHCFRANYVNHHHFLYGSLVHAFGPEKIPEFLSWYLLSKKPCFFLRFLFSCTRGWWLLDCELSFLAQGLKMHFLLLQKKRRAITQRLITSCHATLLKPTFLKCLWASFHHLNIQVLIL